MYVVVNNESYVEVLDLETESILLPIAIKLGFEIYEYSMTEEAAKNAVDACCECKIKKVGE